MFRRSVLVVFLVLGCLSARAQGNGLVGAWKAVTYEIAGVPHPMNGIFLFTQHYYSANVIFRLAGGPNEDANGNAGPYKVSGDEIVFEQWVQVHVRPEDAKQPILSRAGEPEHTKFRREGDKLILLFPSGNRFVLERAAE
jgi:hypothetical protein